MTVLEWCRELPRFNYGVTPSQLYFMNLVPMQHVRIKIVAHCSQQHMHRDHQTWTPHPAEEPLKIEHSRLISHMTAEFSSHQKLCRTTCTPSLRAEHRNSTG